MTDHHHSAKASAIVSSLSSGVLYAAHNAMPAITGKFLSVVENSLDDGTFIACHPEAMNHPLSLLHIIHPLAARDCASGQGTESEMRAKYLHSTGLTDKLTNFTAPLAVKTFRKAGQKATFEGLCQISDPDLFVSATAFVLGMSQKERDFFGYRDVRNLIESKYHKQRAGLVVVHGAHSVADADEVASMTSEGKRITNMVCLPAD